MFTSSAALLALAGSVSAGSILWDGRLNQYTSSEFLNDWSFSNAVGPYQAYIHGTRNITDYVQLSTDYKHPADTGSLRGIQIVSDKTSQWNNDGMLRTELIPQTTAAINKGKVYYHFSMQHTGVNPPSALGEHQINFFESHFTEMKYGLLSGEQGTSDPHLRWMVNSVSHWNTTFAPNVWHNMAYGIDFTAGSVEFYHSTLGDDLKKIAGPVSVSASSNGADWHLGVLRLGTTDDATEHWHFAGVYIESGDLTTSVSGPGAKKAAAAAPVSTRKATTLVTSTKPKSTQKAATHAASTKPKTTHKASSTKAVAAKAKTPKTFTVVVPHSTTSEASVKAAVATSTSSAPSTTSSVLLSTSSASSDADNCEVEYVYV